MNQEPTQDSHCSYCGTRFTEQKLWPRRCFRCYNDSYKNPIPVVVGLIPVDGWYEWGGQKRGMLIQQRTIEPKKGEWALTGGYIDAKETWQQAMVREASEELGLTMREDMFELYDVVSSSDKNTILVFCYSKYHVQEEYFNQFEPTPEVAAVDVMWEHRELAFPSHTEMSRRYMQYLKWKE